MDRPIEVIEVNQEQLNRCAGTDWKALYAECESEQCPMQIRTVQYWGTNDLEQKRDGWVAPTNVRGETLPYLPLNRAWLRCVDGRALLYRQNW